MAKINGATENGKKLVTEQVTHDYGTRAEGAAEDASEEQKKRLAAGMYPTSTGLREFQK